MYNVKYFAYGSNINLSRLKARVEFLNEPVYRGTPFTLEGYTLTFNTGIQYGQFSFANIVPQRGGKVEGILYDLTPIQFERLDRYEMFYQKEFFPIDEDTIGCVYVAKMEATSPVEKKPDLGYLNIILDGCKEEGLQYTYTKLVKYKNLNYKLKKPSKHKFLLP